MKYFIKPLKNKKSNPRWKVQLISYKKEDILKYRGPNHKDKKVTFDVKKEEWSNHGFLTSMSYTEAIDTAKSKNAYSKLEEERAKRIAIQERFEKEELIQNAYLPPYLAKEFEMILVEDHGGDVESFNRSKLKSHWRAVQRLIREVNIAPKEWEPQKSKIFNYFKKKQWSLSYVQKLIILMNKWGYFCARKNESFFQPLSFPKSKFRDNIESAYEESGKKTKESKPLKIEHLKKLKQHLCESQYNWVYLSFWFGLRPKEVNSLLQNEGRCWQIVEQKGLRVLKIYQSKLVGVKKDKRWKLIPCLFPEQETALTIISEKNFKRPLVKTLERYLGEGYKTYAGRKGFESLLRARRVPFEAISSYMGHLDVNRTWNSYRDLNEVILPDETKNKDAITVDFNLKDRSKSA